MALGLPPAIVEFVDVRFNRQRFLDKSQKHEKVIKQIKCAACDFEVHDSEEDEVIRVVQDHAKRKHNKDFTVDQLRQAWRPAEAK